MKKNTKLPTPQEIKAYLDQYVIGQEDAKIVLSVGIYNHYKKLLCSQDVNCIPDMDKSNILMLGETGSGKTLLVRTIAKLLGVPYYIQDCTKVTESGYVGSDVEDCLVGLLRNCNYNIQEAQRGIVVLDEVDKLAKVEAGPSITRDVGGTGVQQSLLKIVEGDVVGVPPQGGRKHPEQSLLYINTKNILFIATGAFVGLEQIIKSRTGQQSIGFGQQEQSVGASVVTPQDLKQFGLIPEFIGRFPIITSVQKLTETDLKRILTEPCNSILSQYEQLLKMDKTELEFSDEALAAICREAMELHTGARGLRNIVERVLTGGMFVAAQNRSGRSTKKLLITASDVERSKQPINIQIAQLQAEADVKKKRAKVS